MSDSKKIIIVRAGGTAVTHPIEIYPDDTVNRFCSLVAPKLGMTADSSYLLLRSDQSIVSRDLYKSVEDGEKLFIVEKSQT